MSETDKEFLDLMLKIDVLLKHNNKIDFNYDFVKLLISGVHHKYKNKNLQQTKAMLINNNEVFIKFFLYTLEIFADKHNIKLDRKYAQRTTDLALRLYKIILTETPDYVKDMYR